MSIFKAPLEQLRTFEYPEIEGLETITVLGDVADQRYFHIGEGVPLPTSPVAEFEPVELSREVNEQLRGQYPAIDQFLLSAVPESVTRRQGLRALQHFGLMPAINTLLDDPETPVELVIDFREAPTFERHGPSLLAIAGRLSLTDEQLDEMFIYAGGV